MGRRPDREALVALVSLAASLGGCSARDDGQWQVCTDAQGRRLPDSACQSGSSWGTHAGWTYISRSASAPAVGDSVSGGTRTLTHGSAFSAPSEGITRGGFGHFGEAFGHFGGAGE